MAIDELTRPLGQTPRRRRTPAVDRFGLPVIAGVLVGALLASVAFLLFGLHRSAKEPVLIRASIPPSPEPRAPPRPPPPPAAAARDHDPPSPASANVITIIDGLTGKRQDVVLTPNPTADPVPDTAHPTEGVGRRKH